MRKGSCCSAALGSVTLPRTRVPHPDGWASPRNTRVRTDRHHMRPDRQTPPVSGQTDRHQGPGDTACVPPPSAPHPPAESFAAYLEVEDNRPYEPQGELGVAICNVVIADVHQFHLKEQQNGQTPPSATPLGPSPTRPPPGAQRGTAPPAPFPSPGWLKGQRSKETRPPGASAPPAAAGGIFHGPRTLVGQPEVLSQHLTLYFGSRGAAPRPRSPEH